MEDKAGGRGWNRGQDGQENGEKGETKNVRSFFFGLCVPLLFWFIRMFQRLAIFKKIFKPIKAV